MDTSLWSSGFRYKNAILVFLAVGLFLLSIDLLSAAIGHLAVGSVAPIIEATNNPFVGLFIGLLLTAILQSSSTTTSMAVAAVAAGSITLDSAIPIILGANIGTTITSTIVAFGYITKANEFRKAVSAAMIHDMFNILGILIIFPLELNYQLLQRASTAISKFMPIGASTADSSFWLSRAFGYIGDTLNDFVGPFVLLLFAVILLFASIKLISRILYKGMVGESQKQFRNTIFRTPLRAFGWGLTITSAVQSSSLTSSLIVPLVATGKVRLSRAFHFLMGANIGTTLTAILAALFRSEAAMSLAIAHFLFNLVVVIIFLSIPFIGRLPLYLAERMGHLMFKFRIAAFVYITLAFFAIPFALIYFSDTKAKEVIVDEHEVRDSMEILH